jgi:hypothetical protein
MGGMEPYAVEGEGEAEREETAVEKALREGGMPEMGSDPDNVISGLGEEPARSLAESANGAAAGGGKSGRKKAVGGGKKAKAKAGNKAGKKAKAKSKGEIELAAESGTGH